MSSTTDGALARGQVLVIFALSLTTILFAAALAFDVGIVLVEQRHQQDAADAAALAGARFLPDQVATARTQAAKLATANGYTTGASSVTVTVNVPPGSGTMAGDNGFIEVVIDRSVPSLFARILGREAWAISARAVAANETQTAAPFALLALDPTACPGLLVEGSGTLNASGNIQVDSTCTTDPNRGMRFAGSGLIVAAPSVACSVVGTYSPGGGVTNDCAIIENAPSVPDPLATLPYPPIPTAGDPPAVVYPTHPLQETGTALPVPPGCPGSTLPATNLLPATCRFTSAYSGTAWRLYPGYYPGGFLLEAGTFYLEPGIYYLEGACTDGGGGAGYVSFKSAGGSVTLTSVGAGGTTPGGGILLFNARHGNAPLCQEGTVHQDGSIVLEGGSSSTTLYPLAQGTVWDGLVIFQDRVITNTVWIRGGTSTMEVRGIVYAPSAQIRVEGGSSTLTVDQVIGATFYIKGNGGTINLAYDAAYLPDLTIAGLVE